MDYCESFGAIVSPKDVRDYRATCAVSTEAFPEEFELPMPKVKNQGSVGSCVAHSLATTIEYFNQHQGDGNQKMSVGYIYGNRTNSSHQGVGMIIRDALQTVQKCGDVPNEKFDHNYEVPGIIELVKNKLVELFPDGYPYRITSYYRVYTDEEIKASLMQNGPVILCMQWFSDIRVKNGIITTNEVASNSYHALVIYGWNNDGWKIQNSWGESWGNKGRAILPYSVTKTETWGVVDTYSENMHKQQEAAYEAKIQELINKVESQEKELEILWQQMDETDNQQNELIELNKKLEQLTIDYNANQQKLEDYEMEIEMLNTQLLEVRKPFSSTFGKLIAKIVNIIVNIFTKK